MFAYEPPLEPYVDINEVYLKPKFIKDTILDICKNIVEKGERTNFKEIYELLYERIEDNLDAFTAEVDYD